MQIFNQRQNMFEMDSAASSLQEILLDQVLGRSIPDASRQYYLSVCRNKHSELKSSDLIIILQSLGLLVIENKELLDPDGLTALVSRSLFINNELGTAKFWSSKPFSKLSFALTAHFLRSG